MRVPVVVDPGARSKDGTEGWFALESVPEHAHRSRSENVVGVEEEHEAARRRHRSDTEVSRVRLTAVRAPHDPHPLIPLGQ